MRRGLEEDENIIGDSMGCVNNVAAGNIEIE
jgi:hypothetical protein